MALLAPVIKAAGLANYLAGIFSSGGFMTIGAVDFQDLEIPASVNWGGQQVLSINRMPGGAKTIDAMGPDETAISWSGVMVGPDASDRARQLNTYRVAGDAVEMNWGDHTYSVVIESLNFNDMQYRVEYKIVCQVLSDDSDDAAASPPSLLDQLKSDVNAAINFVSNPIGAVSGLLPSLGSVASSVAASTGLTGIATTLTASAPLVSGTAAVAAVSGAVASTAATVSAGIASADATVATVATAGAAAGTFLGTTSAVTAGATLTTLAAASGAQAALTNAQGFLGRMATNLGLN